MSMSKSNYEIYAEENQPKVLAKSVTLEECIEELRKCRKSGLNIESMMDFVTLMFSLNFEEVERLVLGEEYWIS